MDISLSVVWGFLNLLSRQKRQFFLEIAILPWIFFLRWIYKFPNVFFFRYIVFSRHVMQAWRRMVFKDLRISSWTVTNKQLLAMRNSNDSQ